MKTYFQKRMRYRIGVIVGSGALFGIGVIILTYTLFASSQGYGSKVATVSFGDRDDVFVVEVADTPAKQRRGLMYRTSLCQRCGMVFIFSESATHPFWMKNTSLSLDILWIEDGEVVDIVEHATPEDETLLMPRVPARYVVELPAGAVREQGIQIGESVRMHY